MFHGNTYGLKHNTDVICCVGTKCIHFFSLQSDLQHFLRKISLTILYRRRHSLWTQSFSIPFLLFQLRDDDDDTDKLLFVWTQYWMNEKSTDWANVNELSIVSQHMHCGNTHTHTLIRVPVTCESFQISPFVSAFNYKWKFNWILKKISNLCLFLIKFFFYFKIYIQNIPRL